MGVVETDSECYLSQTETFEKQESLMITHLAGFDGEARACKVKESIKCSTKFISEQPAPVSLGPVYL